MRVGVLGINHKQGNLELRELLAKACQKRLSPHSSTHGQHSFVLLSTCNRTEVYFSSEELANTHSYLLSILRNDVNEDFDQKLYSYFGKDCLLHLCRVTAGLDSAIVAETEIQGQVKAAYESAQEYQQLPFEMHYFFQKSLAIAKKTRSELPAKAGLPNIEHVVYQTGHHFFSSIAQAKVLFIGASEINKRILSYFKAKNICDISICNRSEKKGMEFSDKYDVAYLPWDVLNQLNHFDWIIVGTKAPEYLVKYQNLPETLIQKKLMIDLSVPRNVDPSLALHPSITLLNIDQINRRLKIRKKRLQQALNSAEEFLYSAIDRQIFLFQEKEKGRLQFSISA